MNDALAYPLTRLLVLITLGLFALVVLRLAYPLAAISTFHIGTGKASLPAFSKTEADAAQIASVESFSAIAERPLFLEERRMPKDPPPAPAAGLIAAVTPSNALNGLTLSGVVMAGDHRVALLNPANGQAQKSVKEGDDFQGWKVLHIEAKAVVFTANGEERRIEFPKPAKAGGITIGGQ